MRIRHFILAYAVIMCVTACGASTTDSSDKDAQIEALQDQIAALQKQMDEQKNSAEPVTSEDSKTESNKNSDNETKSTGEKTNSPSMTASELEDALLNQPMYIVSTEYLTQDTKYKSLYPDMLCAIIKNNSGTNIKNAIIAFVAWDKNNFPIKIKGQYSFDGGEYVVKVDCGDVNMVDGETWGDKKGYSLDEENDISTFKCIVVEYTDFDGNTWKNPLYDTWIAIYENKILE